jgi:TonB family protein
MRGPLPYPRVWALTLALTAAVPAALLAAPSVAHAAPQLTKPPELLTFVEAAFPPSETGKTASVVLAVTIGEDGLVEDATIVTTAGEAFDAAAIAAVKQFVFSPAEIDGKPGRIRIEYQYDFVERVELEVPTTAIFAGVVMDREAKVPLAGVTVTLANGQSAVTDAEGRFLFEDLVPGVVTVTLEGERLTALQTDETFVAGERLDTTYEVFLAEEGEETDDLEILIVAPTIKREAVSTEIPAEEARRVPGTQGDVLRVVESLPGVARASLGTGALVVWGAGPDDTGVYIDGVPVPRLYHDGGLRSVMGSDFVQTVGLVPGGYGAAYGRGLGGLVTVKTQRFDDGLHGAVSADLYDASAAIHGPVGKGWSLGIAGRYGYVAPLLGTFSSDVEDYFPIPNYRDGQARIGYAFSSTETLDLAVLSSSDHTTRTNPNPDPARQAAEDKRLGFERVSLRYVRDVGDGSTVTALVFGGADRSSQVASFGAVETSIEADVLSVGGRASYRSRIEEAITLEGGVDAYVPRTTVTRAGSVAVPSREGDIRVFGQPPPDQIAQDEFTVVNVNLAPYAEADVGFLKDKLHVVPGLRFDPSVRTVSRAAPQVGVSPTFGLFLWDPHVEPRLLVRAAPSETVSFTAAYGQYTQPPQAADLSASFGNPRLPISRARHLVLAGSVRPVDPLSVEITGFRTDTRDLAMRSTLEQPASAEALLPTGRGHTTGVQALVRLDPFHKVYGWVSYTFAVALRQNAPTTAWRPSDYDQRHVLTALGGIELPHELELGARGRLATGYPRTDVVSTYFDSRRDLYQPVFGDHNAIRLPTFYQLDIRVARTFELRTSKVDVSFEVQNVTNTSNTEERIYNADYSEVGAISGLPILPVLGLRWSW